MIAFFRLVSLRLLARLLVRPVLVIPAAALVTPAPIEVHDMRDVLPKHPTKEYPLRPGGSEDIDGAVVHHTASSLTADPSVMARYHIAKGWAGLGYHRGVDFTGAIYVFNSDEKHTNHTAGHNRHNLGLVAIGNYMEDSVTVAMERSLRWQLQDWHERYNLTAIVPHRARKKTLCPGDELMEVLSDVWRENKVTVR